MIDAGWLRTCLDPLPGSDAGDPAGRVGALLVIRPLALSVGQPGGATPTARAGDAGALSIVTRVHPFALPLAILALGVVPAGAVASVSTTVTNGDLSVTLATSKGEADGDVLRDVRGLTVQIIRAGVVARAAAALRPCRHSCGPGPTSAGFVSARIVDLDGDGEREVLVDRADGFNVCCTSETALLARDAKSGDYRELDMRFGSSYGVVAGPLLRGDDVRFYTLYEPRVVGVYLPVRVWQFRAGSVRDVTRAHPDAVRRDLAQHDLAITANARGPRSDGKRRVLRSALPAWATDNELLGRHATVTRRLRELVAARRIEASYPRSLRRLLARLGYRRSSAANSGLRRTGSASRPGHIDERRADARRGAPRR